jgi:hypothetical protein
MNRTFRFTFILGVASSASVACEAIPSTPSVVIEPVVATTEDVLEVILVTESVDAGGDSVTYQVSWFQDGTERIDLTEWTLPFEETRRGERWEVRVVASDGTLESGAADAWVKISNSAPLVNSLALLPEAPRTSDSLELEYRVEDADGDPVAVELAWTVDGEETWHTEPTIQAHATTRGETWSVVVSISDGTDGGEVGSVSALIENTPPSAPEGVAVLPTHPTTDDALVCHVEGEPLDVDGEVISYAIAWLGDGQVFSNTESESLPGDRVPATATSAGQIWSCAATPTDGSDEGEAVAAEPVEISESGG